jgi:hypothetical protein
VTDEKSKREAKETQDKPLEQGINEELVYTLTTTPCGSNPSSPVCKAYDMDQNFLDVTSTVLSGSASASGDVITSPTVKSLTEGHTYMITFQFVSGSNTFQPYVRIVARR